MGGRKIAAVEEVVDRAGRAFVEEGAREVLVVGVQRPDGRIVRGFGRLPGGAGRPDGSTVYEITSITKVFTGLVLARLAEAGSVDLETSLGAVVPGWLSSLRDPRVRDITLRQLALHTSGLPANSSGLWSSALRSPMAPFARLGPADLRRTLERRRLLTPPGARWRYSNLGYGTLGVLLAGITGSSYADLVRELVAEPLGLRHTSLDQSAGVRGRVLGITVPAWSNGVLEAAGDIRSTVDDLLSVGPLAYGEGPDELRTAPALALGSRVDRGPGEWQAIGWQGWRFGDKEYIGHGGGGTFTRANLTANPRKETTIAMLAFGTPGRLGRAERLVPHLWRQLDRAGTA